MIKNYLLFVFLFLIGCISTGPKTKIPSDIKDMVYGEKNSSKQCIESKGITLKDKASGFQVIKVPGEKKFSSGWGWKSPEWNGMWVLGLTYGSGSGYFTIKVGCDPNTMQDVRPQVVKHEFGHFWLVSNYSIDNHDNRFSSCFFNWNDPRIKTMSIQNENGEITIIDYIPDEEIQ